MYPAELITEAQWVAERRGLHRFWTEQPRYSILNRTPETAVFPTTERFGMGVLTFGPLASGWLSGRRDPSSGHRATLAPQGFDLLTGADVELDDAALDRIDELVTPGTELNPQDNYLTDRPALTDKRLRRRRR
jgi:aryl-alcohol dehydrogenase-like predicted oxidoreductase